MPELNTSNKSKIGINGIAFPKTKFSSATNFILSNMEEGELFETVLAEAKAEGYAEPDPTLDINGTDAAHKIGILAALIFNSGLPATNFHIEGIENISPDDFFPSISLPKLTNAQPAVDE